tara:strand:- start:1239 stop:1433 length:195 start_codon:yes stop_codon:yes gene_type:complete
MLCILEIKKMITFVIERWKGRSYNDSDVGYDNEWYEDSNSNTQPNKILIENDENTQIQQKHIDV